MIEAPEWATKKGAGRPAKYPFAEMELYQVIAIPVDQLPPSGFATFKTMLYAKGRTLQKKFVCRQIEDGTVEVCRVK